MKCKCGPYFSAKGSCPTELSVSLQLQSLLIILQGFIHFSFQSVDEPKDAQAFSV